MKLRHICNHCGKMRKCYAKPAFSPCPVLKVEGGGANNSIKAELCISPFLGPLWWQISTMRSIRESNIVVILEIKRTFPGSIVYNKEFHNKKKYCDISN